ncbi:ABC transporter permease [Kushneria aurantia]|uniref:Transport permease protein n=1 Tax=Kushneria aurantia TaxID=504092 RepID=A0ABV6G4J8_9GAMM|nr:ABC transporter permease [Kushneria aurantia]
MANELTAKTRNSRSPLRVTWSVWHALFMREAISRTMADRMAWFWMLFEPIALIAVMIAVRTFIMGGRQIAGADFVPWMIVGLLGFMLFRENMMRAIGAVDANKGLFAYRQVKPIDPVLVRCFLEGMLKTLVFLVFIAIGSLLGIDLIPDHPLGVMFDWLSLWALGWGAGLTLSVASSLIPEIGRVVRIASLPLLIISGVILPLNYLPHSIQQYLLWNPIPHGLESMRLSFFDGYRALPGIDMTYLWLWALSLLALGLILHLRFAQRLKAQ